MKKAVTTKMDLQDSNKENANKSIWFGPPVEDINQLVSEWQSLGHYLLHKLENEFVNTTLFVDFESGRTWTGGQLREKIINVACGLLDIYNFKVGTKVCISYDNSDYVLILALAIICAGGTVACSYAMDPYAELLYLARKVDPSFLFCGHKNIAWANRLEVDLGRSVIGVVMDKNLGDQTAVSLNYFEDLFWYDASKSKSCHLIPLAIKQLKEHIAIIIMSSGTSGKPKAVPQTHWNCLADLLLIKRTSGPSINFACSASLDYVSGRLIMFGAIHSGYRAIILNGFEPRTFLQACERYKVNVIYIGAASFYNLITYKHLEEFDISSLRCVFPMGAKIIYLDELARFFERHPHVVQVRQGYGASELSGCAMNSMSPKEYLVNSENCGRLLPGMRAKILDPTTGQSLCTNEMGILHIRGETVFPGYYDCQSTTLTSKDEQKLPLDKNSNVAKSMPLVNNSEVFDQEGFYISGDYAYFNEKEELFVKGRLKELMSCRGQKKVLPQELEEVIDQHPAVFKVCVLGIANQRDKTLHCPRAFVVPKASYYEQKSIEEVELGSGKLDTLNNELDEAIKSENLTYTGNYEVSHETNGEPLCKMPAKMRHFILEDLIRFVNERVGWEKQLTGGVVLLDEIPTSRSTGKFNKGFLRSLSSKQVEIYADRSA